MIYYTPTKLSENIAETPEGFLLCKNVPIARTGEMEYAAGETPLEGTGIIKITRDEKELFRVETIASFEGKPFTIRHPKDFVVPENWSTLAKGHLQNVRRGEGENAQDLVADILVTDALAIDLIKKGIREVSCGYVADYEQTGIGQGKQMNIIGNHLALVEEGRAGPTYAITDQRRKTMGVGEKIKAIFTRFADEAAKVVDEESKPEEKKEESKDSTGYDELVKCFKDLSDKFEKFSGGKKEESKDEEKLDGEVKGMSEQKQGGKDEGPDVEGRLKALEEKLAKLLEMESSEQSGDEGMPDTVTDEDKEEEEMTGDAKSRAEILAPGIAEGKDLYKRALEASYKTKEGKDVIDSLTGGTLTFDSAEKTKDLFVAVSEILKEKRSKLLANTKRTNDYKTSIGVQGVTPEQVNEFNAKFYKK